VLRNSTLLFFACVGLAIAQRITLQDACALALKNNPRIGVESLNPLLANEAITAARSARFPNILGHAHAVAALEDSRLSAAGAINNPIIFSRLSAGISANQILTDFGRTSHLMQSARLRAESQRQSLQATRSQILLAVHRAFFAALRTLRTKQAAELAQRNATGTEIALAEASLAATAASNEHTIALIELATLFGSSPLQAQNYELIEPDSLISTPPPNATELLTEALNSRPEIATLRLEREAAARFAKAEEKLSMPVIAAVGNAGIAPVHSARLNNRFGAAAILLNIPIFNGHLFEARKNDAHLRLQVIEQRLKELETTVAREVTIVALQADTAYQRLQLLVRMARQPGEAPRDSQLRLAQARYDYHLLRTAIDFQLGRLR
jgi:outer membrane protein